MSTPHIFPVIFGVMYTQHQCALAGYQSEPDTNLIKKYMFNDTTRMRGPIKAQITWFPSVDNQQWFALSPKPSGHPPAAMACDIKHGEKERGGGSDTTYKMDSIAGGDSSSHGSKGRLENNVDLMAVHCIAPNMVLIDKQLGETRGGSITLTQNILLPW